MYGVDISHRHHDFVNWGNGALRSGRPLSKENNREKIRSAILWISKDCSPIAKHLAWKDNMHFQKQTQAHEGEHTFLRQGGPQKRTQIKGILLGTVLRFRSRWDKLEGEILKPSSCAVTLDATGQQNYHGTHPVKITRLTSKRSIE